MHDFLIVSQQQSLKLYHYRHFGTIFFWQILFTTNCITILKMELNYDLCECIENLYQQINDHVYCMCMTWFSAINLLDIENHAKLACNTVMHHVFLF